MKVKGPYPILRFVEPPEIRQMPKPKLDVERERQPGFVGNADANGQRGVDFAVNQRQISRNGFIKMRSFVTNVLSKVGRYSVDRQSDNYGVSKPVNAKLEVEPKPGQLASVFSQSRAEQRFNINSYENTRRPVERSVDNGKQVYETLREVTEKAYNQTESVIEVVKKSVDIIA